MVKGGRVKALQKLRYTTSERLLTSLIATSKRLGIDPFAYLRDLFERLSSHPQSRHAELLPDQWKAGRQSAVPS